MAFRNDVAYLIDDKIIALVEHQATVNANMPLRFLQYVARLYERIQDPRDRYLRCLKKIPLISLCKLPVSIRKKSKNCNGPFSYSDSLVLHDLILRV